MSMSKFTDEQIALGPHLHRHPIGQGWGLTAGQPTATLKIKRVDFGNCRPPQPTKRASRRSVIR